MLKDCEDGRLSVKSLAYENLPRARAGYTQAVTPPTSTLSPAARRRMLCFPVYLAVCNSNERSICAYITLEMPLLMTSPGVVSRFFGIVPPVLFVRFVPAVLFLVHFLFQICVIATLILE